MTPREWEDFGVARQRSLMDGEKRYGASMDTANAMGPPMTVKGYFWARSKCDEDGGRGGCFQGSEDPVSSEAC